MRLDVAELRAGLNLGPAAFAFVDGGERRFFGDFGGSLLAERAGDENSNW